MTGDGRGRAGGLDIGGVRDYDSLRDRQARKHQQAKGGWASLMASKFKLPQLPALRYPTV